MIIMHLPKTTTWQNLNHLRQHNKTAVFEITQYLLESRRYSQFDIGKFGAIHELVFFGPFASEEEAYEKVKNHSR